jgi:LAO/AO transport system kinase
MSSINVESLLEGNIRTLAKAITVVESTSPQDKLTRLDLIDTIMAYTGGSFRIGISGVPGAGKSSLIESLGLLLVELGKKVAVLTIDPSSPVVGGSILADKTRMNLLSREKNAFIRPSPSLGMLGGVAKSTRESILLCEAAGFDIVFIETVGVGQSEYQVAKMVDFFLLVGLPNAGDELQGMKKGILELAHMIVINKCDGVNITAAKLSKQQYENSIDLTLNNSFSLTKVLTCSALNGHNLPFVWKCISEFLLEAKLNSHYIDNRVRQNLDWMEEVINSELVDDFNRNEKQLKLRAKLIKGLWEGSTSPTVAASNLLKTYFKDISEKVTIK